jgi:thiosulfate reductase cytochrome b subunit
MIVPCATAVLMGVLTIGFVLADINFMYGKGAIEHALLGSLVTILFYALCVYGHEAINWIFIGIFLAYLLASILYNQFVRGNNETTDEDSCVEPICEIRPCQNKIC